MAARCRFSSRFCAVTMISPRPWSSEATGASLACAKAGPLVAVATTIARLLANFSEALMAFLPFCFGRRYRRSGQKSALMEMIRYDPFVNGDEAFLRPEC
jgi:hypothetical protein